jgi:hypothetical protein
MPTLIVGDRKLKIPGLGKKRLLTDLSEKRITKAVRDILRSEFGYENITCSCRADVISGTWLGRCWIDGQKRTFRIEEDPAPFCNNEGVHKDV